LASTYGVIKDRRITVVKGLLVPFYKVLVNGQVKYMFFILTFKISQQCKVISEQKYPLHE